MVEFASSFFLVCNDSVDSKLQKAFALYDVDGSGFLEPGELVRPKTLTSSLLFPSLLFYTIVLVSSSLVSS